jgi:2-polyprenyl-3-methyl-5-hydroxy-6-metoxy-1,4-benzoquinol methylase
VTRQREQLKERLAKIELSGKRVVDWGSGAKPAMRYIQHENCHFTTIDKNPDIIPDRRGQEHLVRDIASADLDDTLIDDFDVAFCLEVLEHTLDPQMVVTNIWLSLHRKGKLYLSVPFMFPIHSDEDYWRFTEHGLRYLLRNFSQVDIQPLGDLTGYWVEATK